MIDFQRPRKDLLALEAELRALTEGADVGLALLSDRTDPGGVHSKLQILVSAGRFVEAAQVASNANFPIAATALVATAYAHADDLAAAEQSLLECRMAGELEYWMQGQLSFAMALLSRAQTAEAGSTPTEARRRLATKALTALQPLLAVVEANDAVTTLREERSVLGAMEAHRLLGNTVKVHDLAKLLATRKPIPIDYARAMYRGLIPADAAVPLRLRMDHPESFEARILAVLIQGVRLDSYHEAFGAALGMVGDAKTEEERSELIGVLHELASRLGSTEREQVDSVRELLAAGDDRLRHLFAIERFLNAGLLADASRLLDQTEDVTDPRWLQLKAAYLTTQGEDAAALDLLERAASEVPHPEILKRVAVIAIRQNQMQRAEQALHKLLSSDPNDSASRGLLASVLLRLERFSDAALQYEAILRLQPSSPSVSLSLAMALVRAGEPDRALVTLGNLCSSAAAPAAAHVARSEVLRSLGRASEAYDHLAAVQAQFWDEPSYLAELMELSFLAGDQHIGHIAMQHLLELQREGRAPEIVRSASLEDLQQYANTHLELRRDLAQKIIVQQVPWLFADRRIGQPAYAAWLHRTRHREWVYESSESWAMAQIYATNRYHSTMGISGERRLTRLELPARGSRIVVDWTALITLRELDLLSRAEGYFERLIVPSNYLTEAFEESSKLGGQHNIGVSARAIMDAVHEGRIHVSDTSPARRLDEYDESPSQSRAYGFSELFTSLQVAGCLTVARRDRLALVPCREPAEWEGKSALTPRDRLVASGATLRALIQVGILEDVLRLFQVELSRRDYDEFTAELHYAEKREDIQARHMQLWDYIRKSPRFDYVPSRRSPADQEDERASEFLSVELASELSLPLLVDDRLLQTVIANLRSTEPTAAFGTDVLVDALVAQGLIPIEEAGRMYSRLMSWRYRFLIPPGPVLMEYLGQYRGSEPGEALLRVRDYAHDSLNDPGLLNGEEPTTVPTSVGRQLFHEWTGAIADFIMDVWSSNEVEDKTAERVTRWCLVECLPSPGLSFRPDIGAALWRLTPRILIGRAMIRAIEMQSVDRSRRAVSIMQDCFRLSSDQLRRLVSEVLDVS